MLRRNGIKKEHQRLSLVHKKFLVFLNYLWMHRLMKEDPVHRLRPVHVLKVILMTCVGAIPSHMGSSLYGSQPRTYNILNFMGYPKTSRTHRLKKGK